jgi:hypothetical protein
LDRRGRDPLDEAPQAADAAGEDRDDDLDDADLREAQVEPVHAEPAQEDPEQPAAILDFACGS